METLGDLVDAWFLVPADRDQVLWKTAVQVFDLPIDLETGKLRASAAAGAEPGR